MASQDQDNLVERWIKRCKNQPVLAALIFIAIVLSGVASVSDSAVKLLKLIYPDMPTTPSPTRTKVDVEAARVELSMLELEVPLRRARVEEDEVVVGRAREALARYSEQLKQATTIQQANGAREGIEDAQAGIVKHGQILERDRSSLEVIDAQMAVLRKRIAEAS